MAVQSPVEACVLVQAYLHALEQLDADERQAQAEIVFAAVDDPADVGRVAEHVHHARAAPLLAGHVGEPGCNRVARDSPVEAVEGFDDAL